MFKNIEKLDIKENREKMNTRDDLHTELNINKYLIIIKQIYSQELKSHLVSPTIADSFTYSIFVESLGPAARGHIRACRASQTSSYRGRRLSSYKSMIE